jgi:menaquinone-specific isochorismate synthase
VTSLPVRGPAIHVAGQPAGHAAVHPLVVRTVAVDDPGDLVALLPADAPAEELVAWVRRGEGLVGWGEAAGVRTQGPERFLDAQRWWQEVAASAVVRDPLRLPGSGLVAFGSFAFADAPGDSVLRVPRVVVGRRDGHAWVTRVGVASISRTAGVLPAAAPVPPEGVHFTDGALDGAQWESAVAEAVRRIGRGDLEKVVLARDLLARATAPLDVRWPLQQLARDYPTCWTFAVDRLFGATPEMLIRRERGLVTSRVLAGTIRRTGDDAHDLQLAATLARSSKDLEEHEYAVRSVADALAPHCTSMNVPEAPFVLHLPNVMHLATDVAGVVDPADDQGTTSLELAAALHPSAAVGGTPTSLATALISELEGMDRGRYAGPVGWLDASGDGEWGLALRSGLLGESRDTVRLFAGCGIVADSHPADELAEAQAKFLPVRNALNP